jgi:hypothetical protein
VGDTVWWRCSVGDQVVEGRGELYGVVLGADPHESSEGAVHRAGIAVLADWSAGKAATTGSSKKRPQAG